ncbi:MAG TPA: BatD family protein [Luteimonas sp.]|nr:BatD family protein [Luteimonas sp.]
MNDPRSFLAALLATLLLVAGSATAATRAWLDRDRVALGETATLNIETDQVAAGAPDFSPLTRDFELSGRSSRRQFTLNGGSADETMLYAVALQPRREGTVTVPSLAVGAARTQALSITVTAGLPARAGGVVFIEADIDHGAPYVQQAVGYVVRLYYATQLVSGQLDQPAPDGAAIQRIGSDLQFDRAIGGRRYTVVERHYLLVPERSGRLVIPPARFVGRGVGGFFDEFFGDGQRALSAVGPQRVLTVRAVPPAARQPWLPLRALSLAFVDPPRAARAGEATAVVLQAEADGANATQLPALELEAGDGAQVFAEPPQVEETFDAGRPKVRVTRRFSVVPARAGSLRVTGPALAWWDVDAAAARTASVAALTLDVAPAKATSAGRADADAGDGASATAPDGERRIRVPGVQGEVAPWALATVVFAFLWLATLMWALTRGKGDAPTPAAVRKASDLPPPMPRWSDRDFARVLDAGDLDDVGAALCAATWPPQRDLESLAARLDDPVQRGALAQLQQARWGGGDVARARASLRAAFKGGPRVRSARDADAGLLAPLYPGSREPY